MRTTAERRAALHALSPDAEILPPEEEWTPRPDVTAVSTCDGCSQPRRLRLHESDRWLCCPCWDGYALAPRPELTEGAS